MAVAEPLFKPQVVWLGVMVPVMPVEPLIVVVAVAVHPAVEVIVTE